MFTFTRKKSAKKQASPTNRLLWEELEPRLLFSAGFEAALFDFVDESIEKLSSNNAPMWLDADTGNPISDSSNGDDIFLGSSEDDQDIKANNGDDILYGAEGDDKLYGENHDDLVFGGTGNDILYGGNQKDILHGGLGNDFLYGDNQNDILIGGGGSDYMWGGNQDDVFLFTGAQEGDVYEVDGHSGNDTIDLSEFGPGAIIENDGSIIRVNLGNGQSFIINHSNIENFVTTKTADDNHIPQANAGTDQVVTTNALVTLNGSGSSTLNDDDDDEDSSLTYQWTQIHGPRPWVTLHNSTSSSPSFTAPDTPTTLTFILTVSDGKTQTIDFVEITVIAANNAPTGIHLNNQSINENTDTTDGISIGTLTTIDTDMGDTFAYSIVNGGDYFSIGGNNNDALILDDGLLDYETKPAYSVIIRSEDAGGLGLTHHSETFVIRVINDQPPTAQEDTLIVDAGNTATLLESGQISVLTNDTDAEQLASTLVVSLDIAPEHAATFTLNPDGTFSYTHDGSENFFDSFTYTVTDNDAQTDTAIVTIHINPNTISPKDDANPAFPEDEHDPENNPNPTISEQNPVIIRPEMVADNTPVTRKDLSRYHSSSNNNGENSISLVTHRVSYKPLFSKYAVNGIAEIFNENFSHQQRLLGTPNYSAVDPETTSHPKLNNIDNLANLAGNDANQQPLATWTPLAGTTSDSVFQAITAEFVRASATPVNPISEVTGKTAQKASASANLKKLIKQPEFIRSLDKLRKDTADQVILDKTWIASSMAVSSGLSVGYVIWLVRGGVLLSTLLSTLPAWRIIDPLPILIYANKRSSKQIGEEDKESLESMVMEGNGQFKGEPFSNKPLDDNK